jgi:hypothetical protein
VSKTDGIVFKRILNSVTKGFLTLKSDNLEYAPYDLSISDVVEVWKAEGITHFGFQNESQALQGLLFKELQDIKSELSDLKNKI